MRTHSYHKQAALSAGEFKETIVRGVVSASDRLTLWPVTERSHYNPR